jgi:hypothetical protein
MKHILALLNYALYLIKISRLMLHNLFFMQLKMMNIISNHIETVKKYGSPFD